MTLLTSMALSLAELPLQKFHQCLTWITKQEQKILDGSWIDEVSSSADAIPDVESGDSSSNTGHVDDGQYNTATEEREVIPNSGVTAAAECRQLMAVQSTQKLMGMLKMRHWKTLDSVAVIDETCFCLGADVSRGPSYKTDATPSQGGLSRSLSSPVIASTQLPRQLPPQAKYAELCVQ